MAVSHVPLDAFALPVPVAEVDTEVAGEAERNIQDSVDPAANPDFGRLQAFQAIRQEAATVSIMLGTTWTTRLSMSYEAQTDYASLNACMDGNIKQVTMMKERLEKALVDSEPTWVAGLILGCLATVTARDEDIWKLVFRTALTWVDPGRLVETVVALVAIHAHRRKDTSTSLMVAACLVAAAPKSTAVARDIASHLDSMPTPAALKAVVSAVMEPGGEEEAMLRRRVGNGDYDIIAAAARGEFPDESVSPADSADDDTVNRRLAVLLGASASASTHLASHGRLNSPWAAHPPHATRARTTLPGDVDRREGADGTGRPLSAFKALDTSVDAVWQAAGMTVRGAESLRGEETRIEDEVRAHGKTVEFITRYMTAAEDPEGGPAVAWAVRHAALAALDPFGPLQMVSAQANIKGKDFDLVRDMAGLPAAATKVSLPVLGFRKDSTGNAVQASLIEDMIARPARHPSCYLLTVMAACASPGEFAVAFYTSLFYAVDNGLMDAPVHALLAFALARVLAQDKGGAEADDDEECEFGGQEEVFDRVMALYATHSTLEPGAGRPVRARVAAEKRMAAFLEAAAGAFLADITPVDAVHVGDASCVAVTGPCAGEVLSPILTFASMVAGKPWDGNTHLPVGLVASKDAFLKTKWSALFQAAARVASMSLVPVGDGGNVALRQVFCLNSTTPARLAQAIQRAFHREVSRVTAFHPPLPDAFPWAWTLLTRLATSHYCKSIPLVTVNPLLTAARNEGNWGNAFNQVVMVTFLRRPPVMARVTAALGPDWKTKDWGWALLALAEGSQATRVLGGSLPRLPPSLERLVGTKRTHTTGFGPAYADGLPTAISSTVAGGTGAGAAIFTALAADEDEDAVDDRTKARLEAMAATETAAGLATILAASAAIAAAAKARGNDMGEAEDEDALRKNKAEWQTAKEARASTQRMEDTPEAKAFTAIEAETVKTSFGTPTAVDFLASQGIAVKKLSSLPSLVAGGRMQCQPDLWAAGDTTTLTKSRYAAYVLTSGGSDVKVLPRPADPTWQSPYHLCTAVLEALGLDDALDRAAVLFGPDRASAVRSMRVKQRERAAARLRAMAAAAADEEEEDYDHALDDCVCSDCPSTSSDDCVLPAPKRRGRGTSTTKK